MKEDDISLFFEMDKLPTSINAPISVESNPVTGDVRLRPLILVKVVCG